MSNANDPILRRDAIREVCYMMRSCFDADDEELDAIETTLKEIPSVQPERQCNTCSYNCLSWDEEPCDSCTMGGGTNRYKPSVQREIVRCKDCVHWTTWLNRTPLVNKYHCDIHFNLGHEDFYCADGRRKDAEIR